MKKILKKILPKKLLTLIYRRKVLRKLYLLNKSIKKIEKKPRDLINGPKLVFILQFSAAWNSFCSVYNAAVKSGLSVIVLCIPTFNDKKGKYISGTGLNNAAYELCLKNNVICINAWQNEKWFDMKAYEPDYVIYSRPYNSLYPQDYKSSTVCRYAKICFIPYTYHISEKNLFDVVYNIGFISDTYISFTPNEFCMKECKRRYRLKRLFVPKSFVCLGYPNFDLYALPENKNKSEKLQVLWLPRWTAPTDHNRQSHFLDYYYHLVEYATLNKNVNIIIRPHPLMFSNFIEKGVMSEQEVKSIFQTVESMDNVEFDNEKDYIISLKRADILISDYSSLLADAFVADKPTIYCDTPQGFNDDGLIIYSALYHANNWTQLNKQLELLIQGRDDLAERRKELINKIVPDSDGNIGKNILDYIVMDYTKK